MEILVWPLVALVVAATFSVVVLTIKHLGVRRPHVRIRTMTVALAVVLTVLASTAGGFLVGRSVGEEEGLRVGRAEGAPSGAVGLLTRLRLRIEELEAAEVP
jgi:hypothetical protein